MLTLLIKSTASMNIKSIATGIESKDILDEARLLGIDYVQGY